MCILLDCQLPCIIRKIYILKKKLYAFSLPFKTPVKANGNFYFYIKKIILTRLMLCIEKFDFY